ncbi:MAG TPA: succinylglutamate-semialdehyde dehydrogenase [Chthoniobacterales bacterium]
MLDQPVAGRRLARSGEPFTSINPATGQVIGTFQAAGPEEVAKAYAAAVEAQPAWAGQGFQARRSVAEGFANLLASNREHVAALISDEVGKPRWEARQEVDAMVRKVALSAEAYLQRTGTEAKPAGDAVSELTHAPHGIVAVLGPFNFPGHLPNGHIVPAVLAGNAVLFKPSEFAPAVGICMGDLWRKAGLPAGVLTVLPGGLATAEEILDHPALRGVFFTGSAAAGRAIHRRFAGKPDVILALEMGGNNPMVVLGPNVDGAAARTIAVSAFLSAGQRCTCTRRLIVVGDPDLEPLCKLTRSLQVGFPADDPFMGPVIHRSAAERVLQFQEDFIRAGASALVAVRPAGTGLPFLSPGIIDVTNLPDRPDEEIFGPLLQVIRVHNFNAALDEANRTRYGLAAGLIGGTAEDFATFRQHLRAGIVNWNRPTTGASSAAPFGGVGWSGNHRPGAFYAADYCAYPVASLTGNQALPPAFPGMN